MTGGDPLLLLTEALRTNAGERAIGYADKASWRAGPVGTVADEVSGDSIEPSVMGLVPRISSTSRLGLLPPLGIPFRFGVVDDVTSGDGLRGLDKARISLEAGGRGLTVIGEAATDCLCEVVSVFVLAGETNASGVSRLMWLVAAALTMLAGSYSDVVLMVEKDDDAAPSPRATEVPSSKTALHFCKDLGCTTNIFIITRLALSSPSKSSSAPPIGWEGLIKASRMAMLIAEKGSNNWVMLLTLETVLSSFELSSPSSDCDFSSCSMCITYRA